MNGKSHIISSIERAIETIAVILALLISNRRTWLCIFEVNKPLFWCEYGDWVQETLWYIVILGILIWVAHRQRVLQSVMYVWKKIGY